MNKITGIKHYCSRLLLSLLMLITGLITYGQGHYKYYASLGEITQAGFYKVSLSPAIVAKCNKGIYDIRLMKSDSTEVPYILKSELPSFKQENFIEFPIISKEKEKGKYNTVTLENADKRSIKNLWLTITNNSANRVVTISGSDDNKNWYVIREHITLDNTGIAASDNFIQSLSFPPCSYKYFRIIMEGEKLLPVNITKAGIYEPQLIKGEYETIASPSIIQKDSSNKTSYVDVRFDDDYQLDEIEINLSGPKFFKRVIRIYCSINNEQELALLSFISSGSRTNYPVAYKGNLLYLQIDNDDNPPLKIQSIKGYQLNRYLLAYLEPGKNYRLLFGDSLATEASYDLRFFKDSVQQILTTLHPGSIERTAGQATVQTRDSNKGKWVLWISIAIVLLILLALSIRLIKEITKRDPS